MAAHYVAHLETDAHEALNWNLTALRHATLDARTEPFMGSLLVSLGAAYHAVGQIDDAEHYFALASERGVEHYRGQSGLHPSA